MKAKGRLALAASLAVVVGGSALWMAMRETTPAASLERESAPAAAPAKAVVEDPLPPAATTPAADGATASQAVARPLSHVALLRFSVANGSEGAVGFASVTPRARAVPRRPAMPLADHRLVVAIEDGDGNELWRTVIADPRLVRGEFFDSDGRIEQSVQVRRDGAASIVYPHDDAAHRLVVLEPVRAAGGFAERRIASWELP